jgi:hypothetical protein
MFIGCFVTEQYLLKRKYRNEKIEITVACTVYGKQNKIFSISISVIIILLTDEII